MTFDDHAHVAAAATTTGGVWVRFSADFAEFLAARRKEQERNRDEKIRRDLGAVSSHWLNDLWFVIGRVR